MKDLELEWDVQVRKYILNHLGGGPVVRTWD
jgi:hypothetical protein